MLSLFGQDLEHELGGWRSPYLCDFRSLRSPNDIKETETGYSVSVDIPGVPRENVKVAVEDCYIEISAQSETNFVYDRETGEKHKGKSHRSYNRKFSIPVDVDKNSLEASLENGVLTLHMEKQVKREGESKRYLSIESKDK